MQDDADKPEPKSLSPRAGCGLCALLSLTSFVALAGSGSAASWRRPPEFQESWLVSGALSFLAVGLCFYVSANHRQLVIRIVCGLSLAICLFSLAVPVHSYYMSYGDYPWMVVVPLLVSTIGGGIVCGQRMISIGLVVFCAYWLQGMYMPPSVTLPATVRQGDFTLTINPQSDSYSGASLAVASTSGSKVTRDLDLRYGHATARSGPFIFDEGFVHGFTELDLDPEYREEIPLSLRISMPRWVRTWDLEVPIQAWPPTPATGLTIPIPTKLDKTLITEGKGFTIAASGARITKTTSTLPVYDSLFVRLAYRGSSECRFRVSNDSGYPLDGDGGAFQSLSEDNPCELRIYPIRNTKAIHIDFFTREQLDKNRLIFRFRGLPNPN
jgi:hypothetical protein